MNAGERGILWWSMSVVSFVDDHTACVYGDCLCSAYISKALLLGAVKYEYDMTSASETGHSISDAKRFQSEDEQAYGEFHGC